MIPNLTFLRTKKDDGVFTKAGTKSPRPLGVGAADAVNDAKQQQQEEGRGRRTGRGHVPQADQTIMWLRASRDLPNFSVVLHESTTDAASSESALRPAVPLLVDPTIHPQDIPPMRYPYVRV